VLVSLRFICVKLGMRGGRAKKRNEIKSENYIEKGPSIVPWGRT